MTNKCQSPMLSQTVQSKSAFLWQGLLDGMDATLFLSVIEELSFVSLYNKHNTRKNHLSPVIFSAE